MKLRPTLQALTLSLVVGCAFHPDENFVEVDPQPKAALSGATLQSTNLMTLPDTFEITTRERDFTAELKFDDATIMQVGVTVDDKYITSSDKKAALDFKLKPADYTDGYHKIRMKAVTNSGTGSMADVQGEELLEWTRDWTFRIRRITPPVVNITKVAPSGGGLRVEFEPSPVPTERQLDFEWRSNNGFSVVTWSRTVTDPAATSVVDDRFIEGKLKVTITNLSVDPKTPSGISAAIEASFEAIPTIVATEPDGHGNVTVRVSRSLFYNNIKYYTLYVDDRTFRSKGGSDTSFLVKDLNIGWAYSARVRTSAFRLNGSDTVRLDKTPLSVLNGENIGHSLSVATWSTGNTRLGFAFDRGKKIIDVLDGTTVERSFAADTLDDQFDWTMGISRNGQYYYFIQEDRVYRIDRNGNSSEVFNVKTALASNYSLRRISVGDRYIAFYAIKGNLTTDRTVALYDLQDGVVKGQLTSTSANKEFISADGKYLAVWSASGVNVYTISDGTLTLKKTFSGSLKDIIFTTVGTQQLVIGGAQMIKYNPETDQTQTITYSTSQGPSAAFRAWDEDPITGLLSFLTNEYLYLIDPATGEFKRKFLNNSTGAFYTLYNNDVYRDSRKYNCKF